VSCRPEDVTAFVDGELRGPARDHLVAHLASGCARCVAQSEEERALRRSLRPAAGRGLRALTGRLAVALDRVDAARAAKDPLDRVEPHLEHVVLGRRFDGQRPGHSSRDRA
jgi:hypothetical protein